MSEQFIVSTSPTRTPVEYRSSSYGMVPEVVLGIDKVGRLFGLKNDGSSSLRLSERTWEKGFCLRSFRVFCGKIEEALDCADFAVDGVYPEMRMHVHHV